MNKIKNNENKLFESLLKLNIKCAIEDSNINIRMINSRITVYHNLINHLEENKPLFFQRKKFIEYENKKENYKIKIEELYQELNEEYQLLEKLLSNEL